MFVANPTHGMLAKTSRMAAVNNCRMADNESIQYPREMCNAKRHVLKIIKATRADAISFPHFRSQRFSRCR